MTGLSVGAVVGAVLAPQVPRVAAVAGEPLVSLLSAERVVSLAPVANPCR
jgi:hypothetical protein